MARKQHKYHYIYKTTCKVTGRYYIGMHSTSNLEDGYIGSGKRLWYSIRKHGRENHSIEILEWLPNRSSLKEREKELVNETVLQDSQCMNLKLGGEGGFTDREHQRKAQLLGAISTLKIMRERLKKKELENPESKNDRVNKMKATSIEKYGSANGWKNKKHNSDSIERMRIAKKEFGKGEKNSQFATTWITKNGTNKKIKNTDLDQYIQNEWIRGRKLNKKETMKKSNG